jgi:hypothetical protein
VIEDHDCNTLRFHLDPQGKPVELEPFGLRIDADGSYVVWRVRPHGRLVFADPQWLTAFNNT